MAAKGNIRSMRFSDDVIKLIEEQPGDTFTAKFETLIYKCVRELPEKQNRVIMIQQLIDAESKRLDSIRKKAANLEENIQTLTNNLHWFAAQAQRAVNSIDRLVNDCNTD